MLLGGGTNVFDDQRAIDGDTVAEEAEQQRGYEVIRNESQLNGADGPKLLGGQFVARNIRFRVR